MELTAATADLAAAAADAARLLPARPLEPVLAGLVLTAGPDGLVLAATDRERSLRLNCPARTHTDGAVLVPGRPFAETLRALDEPEVRLVVEGSRLAVRTGRARFALPLLDLDRHPGVAEPPPVAGRVAGPALLHACAAVAGAASRDDALPLFTGVRLRAHGDVLRLVGTDRYRLAVAELPWQPAGPDGLDVLIPATLLTEIARQAAGATELVLHADADRAALAWAGRVAGTALLAAPFPDESRYLTVSGDASATVSGPELIAAVRRAQVYAGPRAAVAIGLADGELRIRADSPELGEAEETVKAQVTGRLEQHYRTRYLLDALRAFGEGSGEVRLDVKRGLKSTVFTAPEPGEVNLRYLVMPLLPPR